MSPHRATSAASTRTRTIQRSRRSLSLGAALAVVGLSLPILAYASPATPDDVGSLQDSSKLTTPVVLRGKLLSDTKQAVAGAQVVLYAWPSNDVLERQVVGDAVNLQAVGVATTRADGAYDLRLASANTLAASADSTNLVNLTAVASSAAHLATWSFSRRLATASGGARQLADVVDDRPASTSATPVASPAVVDLQLDGTASEKVPTDVAAASEAGTVVKGCISNLLQTYDPSWVLVGQNYSSTAAASANFQYYKDASSTLGIGTSASGTYGSWKQSGTASRSSNSSIDFPTTKGAASRYHDTKFQFAKYRVTCIYGGGQPLQHYEVRPYKYVSGSRERSVSTIGADYCTVFAAGSKFTAETTTSITWSDGVDISAVIGIDFSVQTGYTTKARIQWSFSSKRYLCGTNDYPGEGTYRRLRAKRGDL